MKELEKGKWKKVNIFYHDPSIKIIEGTQIRIWNKKLTQKEVRLLKGINGGEPSSPSKTG